MNKKSIFKFYLTLHTAFVFVGVIIVGIILLSVATNYYSGEIMEKYISYSDSIKAKIDDYCKYNPDSYKSDDFAEIVKPFVQPYEVNALLLDSYGTVISSTNSQFAGLSVSGGVLPNDNYEGNFTTDDLDGFFSGRECCYISEENIFGESFYLLIYGSQNNIRQFNRTLYIVYIASAVFFVFFFTFIIAKVLTYIIHPLNEMTKIARQYSNGDFSQRIAEKGDGEINELAHVLNEMADSITENEKVRMSFIANVSHELRTPMTSIGGFIDGILSGTIPPESERHYLLLVSEEVNRLSRLVRSMLNLSKYESNEMQINCTDFNISDMLVNTVFLFEKPISKKNVDVRGLDECEKLEIFADRDLIQQVLYNLTENAVKFVNESGYIHYSVKKDGKKVCIGIKNSGEGVSKKDLPHLFDKFYKTDASRGKDKSGVGLGLSIVKSVITLHHGEISVASNPDGSVEFVIELPISSKNENKSK